RTLHVVDLPGHGYSVGCEVPLALEPCTEAVARAVPEGAPWCGWSLGGLVALHAAATRPDAVPALAMLCASPRFVRGDDWKYGVSAEIFRDFAAGLRSDYRGTLDRFVALEAFGSEHARDEIRALRDELFARCEPAAAVLADGLVGLGAFGSEDGRAGFLALRDELFAGCEAAAAVLADGLELVESADLRHVLPGLRAPSLWLAGRRDRLVDPRAMREAAVLAG